MVGSWMIAWYAVATCHSGSIATINAADFRRRQTGRPFTSAWRRAHAFPDSTAVTLHLSSSHIGILILFSHKRSLTV
jgi:hypothetical protein